LQTVSASVIPDGVWTRLYMTGMTPEEAARAPELQSLYQLPVLPAIKCG
jgi:hypothetical protein